MGLRDIELTLPPGFRFYPSDEELVCYYLHSKVANDERLAGAGWAMVEVDLHIHEPWELPDDVLMALQGNLQQGPVQELALNQDNQGWGQWPQPALQGNNGQVDLNGPPPNQPVNENLDLTGPPQEVQQNPHNEEPADEMLANQDLGQELNNLIDLVENEEANNFQDVTEENAEEDESLQGESSVKQPLPSTPEQAVITPKVVSTSALHEKACVSPPNLSPKVIRSLGETFCKMPVGVITEETLKKKKPPKSANDDE
ncbi:hypothetical protein ACP70R_001147 [Stipagrostis hirtigluma subsp. patula]